MIFLVILHMLQQLAAVLMCWRHFTRAGSDHAFGFPVASRSQFLMQGGAAEGASVLCPGADSGHGGVLEGLPNWRRRHVAHVWRGWPGRRHGQAPGARQPPALESSQELGRQRCHAPGWAALFTTTSLCD